MPFYAKNQLVWAKIKGYPWWPAIVAKSNQTRNGAIEDEVLVNFIGENSHAVVAMDRVADFEETFEEHSESKNKRLQESIKTAQRIQEGISTYEEEKSKLLKRGPKPAIEEKSPEKTKPVKLTKRKDSESKDSPKVGRPVSRIKDKGSAEKKYELLESAQHRFTRSRSKQENIEMLTEPLIYNSRKSHRSPGKGGRRRNLRGGKRRGNRHGEEEDEEGSEGESGDDEDDDEEDDEDEEHEEEESEEEDEDENEEEEEIKTIQVRKRGRRPVNTRSSNNNNNKAAAAAPKGGAKRGRGNRRHLKKTPVSKARMEHEDEESKKSDNDTPMSLIKESRVHKEDEQDMELEKMLEDVDDEDCESFDLNMDSYMDQEMRTGQDNSNKTEKRLMFSHHDDMSPKYITQTGDRDFKNATEDGEFIMKKVKPNNSNDEGKSNYANSSTKTVMAYNSLKIRKFENDLEQLLNKMSKKFLNKDKLKEEDSELLQLLNVIQEFENNTFNGVEFINSDLGKLFKTVHFLFTKNKDLLCKTADSLIATLARVLHKIKNKIIQHCLDNKEYVESLHLPEEQRENTRQPVSMSAINVDENRTKIEESGMPNQTNAMITTKMEEEDSSRRQRVSTQANTPVIKKEEIMPATSNIYKAEAAEQAKRQEGNQQGQQVSNFQLRKKICQKFAALLQRVYSMEKNKSQELTLQIEEKINNFYVNNVNDYKQAIKRLLKIIKANKLEVDELLKIQDFKLNEFSTMLKQKLETIVNFVESPEAPEPSVSTVTENKREINSQKKNNKINKNHHKNTKDTEIAPRKTTRASKKEASSTENNNIVTKLDDMHGTTIKEEADRASYQLIKIPPEASYQQKIEYV